LFFQVLILQSEKVDFTFEVKDNLFLLIHLNNRLILNVHSSRSVVEGRNSFVCIH
jgi:hypothetical protein